ncbi:hypothetical protein [Nocardioides sp. LML1-1-1.1]|uniref:hypothetical protein n=1 Tax=Nocardioides sp. LML1-1-1.1 TaxID=3135248 RepID=UPI003426B92C
MQDIIERLDAELRTVPAAGFEIEQAVRTGRTAVRRRRVALGGAGLAAVLAVGGLAWAVGPGSGPDGGPDGGTDRTPVAGSPTPTPAPAPEPWEKAELIRVDAEGTITLNPAAAVLEQTRVTDPEGTVHRAFELRLDGQDYYAVADDAGYASQPLPAQGLTLREWAQQLLTLGTSESGSSDEAWVRINERSRVRPEPGVEIVASRPDPGLGDRFAPAGQPTAVAEVVRDGVTWFLAVRRLPGGATEAIPYRKDATVPTLSAFVAYARTQYAPNESGGSEGLR